MEGRMPPAEPGACSSLGERAPAPPADARPIYTCPNLPDVDHFGPGDCPLCGSRLEPKEPIAAMEEDEDPKLVHTRRRFWQRWRWPWAS